jgi:hypothetical protein
MGLLDKVKEQAAVATAAAKDAAAKGQAKYEEAQAKRAADVLLRQLGLATYAEKTGRATDGTAADVDRLVGMLKDHEAAHGPIGMDGEPASDGQSDGG